MERPITMRPLLVRICAIAVFVFAFTTAHNLTDRYPWARDFNVYYYGAVLQHLHHTYTDTAGVVALSTHAHG
jgi:hypothetical protein